MTPPDRGPGRPPLGPPSWWRRQHARWAKNRPRIAAKIIVRPIVRPTLEPSLALRVEGWPSDTRNLDR